MKKIFILFTVLFFVSCQNTKEKKEQLFSIKTDKYSLVVSKIRNKVEDGKLQCNKYVRQNITDSSFYSYGNTIKGLLQSLRAIKAEQIEDESQLLPKVFLEVDCRFRLSKEAIKDTIVYHLLDFFKLKEQKRFKQIDVFFLTDTTKKAIEETQKELNSNIEISNKTIVFNAVALNGIASFLNNRYAYFFNVKSNPNKRKYTFSLPTSESLEEIIKKLKQEGITIEKEKAAIIFYNYEKSFHFRKK